MPFDPNQPSEVVELPKFDPAKPSEFVNQSGFDPSKPSEIVSGQDSSSASNLLAASPSMQPVGSMGGVAPPFTTTRVSTQIQDWQSAPAREEANRLRIQSGQKQAVEALAAEFEPAMAMAKDVESTAPGTIKALNEQYKARLAGIGIQTLDEADSGKQPFVNPIGTEEYQQLTGLPKPIAQVGAGLQQFGSGMLEMFKDPLVIAGGLGAKSAKPMSEAIATVFGAQMIAHAPEQIKEAYDNWVKGDKDKAIANVLNVATSAYFAPKLLKHGFSTESLPIEATIAENNFLPATAKTAETVFAPETQTKGEQRAVSIESANSQVLPSTQPEVGLQRVDEANAASKTTPGTQAAPETPGSGSQVAKPILEPAAAPNTTIGEEPIRAVAGTQNTTTAQESRTAAIPEFKGQEDAQRFGEANQTPETVAALEQKQAALKTELDALNAAKPAGDAPTEAKQASLTQRSKVGSQFNLVKEALDKAKEPSTKVDTNENAKTTNADEKGLPAVRSDAPAANAQKENTGNVGSDGQNAQASIGGEKVGPGDLAGPGGAAVPSEFPGEGNPDVYGIAARVRADRAKAGQVADVPTGQGITAEDSVERGRALLKEGRSAEGTLDLFEKTKSLSAEDMAVVRARGEELALAARRTEEKFGTDSPEYKSSWDALSEWDRRIKPMQTEWHKIGMAQQGETDIDTGSFTGLQRAYKDATDKDFTPEQASVAKEKASQVKKASEAEAEASQKLADHIIKSPTPEPDVEPHVRLVAEKLKEYFRTRASNALSKIKARRSEGRMFTGIDPTEMLDYADYGASKILEKGINSAEMTAEWAKEMVDEIGDYIKPHLQDIWNASRKTFEDGFKKIAGVGEQADKVRKVSQASIPNAAQEALDAASKTVREAAARAADEVTKARVREAAAEKEVQRIKTAPENVAQAAASKTVREAAVRRAKADKESAVRKADLELKRAQQERKIAERKADKANADVRAKAIKAAKAETKERVARADFPSYVWAKAREYISNGMDDFNDIRTKLATDLGTSVEKVTAAMAKDKRAKYLADDLWKKQQVARTVRQQSKRWLTQTSIPGYMRAIQSVPRILFGLKVGFHGTVALGTHAPMVAFQPRFWGTYVRDFGKMYKMVGSKSYYEMQVQDLIRRPNYITARRAGLVNDPFTYEDFNSPDTAKYFGNLTGMGNRGYAVLKIIRQDMFDQMWGKLPKTSQIPEVAQAIADGLNHATGVVKGKAPPGSNVLMFAPRLAASRAMWLVGDPLKAVNTFANWKSAPLGDKTFAMNQLKEKAWVAGTFFGLLALNQGFLSATGSKQKINGIPESMGGGGFDPMESDFMKFKAAGLDVAYGSAMLNMAKLPVRMATAIAFEGKSSKLILEDERVYKIAGDYLRSQMSPFAGTTADLALGRDYAGRPLPRAGFGLIDGKQNVPKRLAQHGITEPYTWTEYSSIQFTPIPISEAIREVWGQGLGMSDEQINHYMKALIIISTMAGTGSRVTEDWKAAE